MARGHAWRYYAVFFVAGMPALIYQVVWQRVLKLYFGVDIYSTAVIVASFMLGLGLGSLLGGFVADRTRRPAVLYGLLEFCLGLFGVFSLPLFSTVASAMAGASLGPVMLTTFLLLLIPTILMGATLPLMCRTITGHDTEIGHHLSQLYAWNAIGAAFGALLSAYLIIGLLGLAGATVLAAGANVLLAGLVLLISRGSTRLGPPVLTPDTPAANSGAAPVSVLAYRDVLLISFLSGFVALAYELLWYRVLGALLHSTVYVFGTLLFFYLAGIGIGSILARRHIDKPGAASRFALCQLGISAYVLLLFALLGYGSALPGLKHLIAASAFTGFHPAPSLVAGVVDVYSVYSLVGLIFWMTVFLLVPTILMGYGFPNLIREGATSIARLGKDMSGVLFWNIVGATFGSLAVGFFGLRYLGTEQTLRVLVLLGCVAPTLVFWRKRRAAQRLGNDPAVPTRRLALSVGCALFCALISPPTHSVIRAVHFAAQNGCESIILEDHTGTVALRRQDRVIAFPQEQRVVGQWRLYIDGSSHGDFLGGLDDVVPDEDLQAALAAHPRPRRVLSIGLGDGMMCATAALCPQVEELVIIELNGSLREMLARTGRGRAIFDSKKVRFIVDDGRRWLLANPTEKFDLVLMWPLHAAHAYSGSLYSLEFFEVLRQHLNEDGLLYTRSADAYSTARTLATAFPYVLRLGTSVYVCGRQPIAFDPARLPHPIEWLAGRIEADHDFILQSTTGLQLNRDFFPISEYYITYRHADQLITRTDLGLVRRYKLDDGARAMVLRSLPASAPPASQP